MKLTLAIVGLGSNIGDRAAYLAAARAKLQKLFPSDFAASPIYETNALTEGQDPYLNQVVYFARSDAGRDSVRADVAYFRAHPARFAHPVYLGLCLYVDLHWCHMAARNASAFLTGP